MELLSAEFLSALLAIVIIDLVLAGDNVIVIALAVFAAAGVATQSRIVGHGWRDRRARGADTVRRVVVEDPGLYAGWRRGIGVDRLQPAGAGRLEARPCSGG